jgi:hypothetical protein
MSPTLEKEVCDAEHGLRADVEGSFTALRWNVIDYVEPRSRARGEAGRLRTPRSRYLAVSQPQLLIVCRGLIHECCCLSIAHAMTCVVFTSDHACASKNSGAMAIDE